MAVAFAAVGVFIELEFRRDQAATLDEGLRARLRDLTAGERGRQPPGVLAQLGTAGSPLLTPAEERRAAAGRTIVVSRRDIPGTGDVRLRAGPASGGLAAAVAEPL